MNQVITPDVGMVMPGRFLVAFLIAGRCISVPYKPNRCIFVQKKKHDETRNHDL